MKKSKKQREIKKRHIEIERNNENDKLDRDIKKRSNETEK